MLKSFKSQRQPIMALHGSTYLLCFRYSAWAFPTCFSHRPGVDADWVERERPIKTLRSGTFVSGVARGKPFTYLFGGMVTGCEFFVLFLRFHFQGMRYLSGWVLRLLSQDASTNAPKRNHKPVLLRASEIVETWNIFWDKNNIAC